MLLHTEKKEKEKPEMVFFIETLYFPTSNRNMDPQLVQEIHAAHEEALHARDTLVRLVNEMQLNDDMEWEEAYELAQEAKDVVDYAVEKGQIAMETMTAIMAQGEEIPVQINNRMIQIAQRFTHMQDEIEDAVAAQSKIIVEDRLIDARDIALEIGNLWTFIHQIISQFAVDPINMSSNNESNGSNAEGGRRLRKRAYRGKTHRGKTHRGKTQRKRTHRGKTHRKRNKRTHRNRK
jgi:hypothetical protein